MATAPLEQDDDVVDDYTKPPFLKRVRIRGYKSIAYCDVALQPFTILVGRNGSGKSNFLDALAFLRDAMTIDLPTAVHRHGGRESVRCRSANTEVIAIELGITLLGNIAPALYDVEYSFQVVLPAGSSPSVRQESCRIHKPNEAVLNGFDVNDGAVKWSGTQPHPLSETISEFPRNQLLLSVFNFDDISELNQNLRTMAIYNFNPAAIRRLQKPSPGYLLDRDGSNLASVIQTLKEADPEQLQRAREYLSYINEDVDSFDPVRYGDFETVQFRMKPRSGGEGLTFNAESMSDGTLRALAAMMAGFQISNSGRPSLVAIEEPETSLHPSAARDLVSTLRAATEHTQVLLTCHSTDFLEERDLQGSELLVVRSKDGQTQIAPVDAASREIVERQMDTFGGRQREGRLEPDWKDLERQAKAQSVNGE